MGRDGGPRCVIGSMKSVADDVTCAEWRTLMEASRAFFRDLGIGYAISLSVGVSGSPQGTVWDTDLMRACADQS